MRGLFLSVLAFCTLALAVIPSDVSACPRQVRIQRQVVVEDYVPQQRSVIVEDYVPRQREVIVEDYVPRQRAIVVDDYYPQPQAQVLRSRSRQVVVNDYPVVVAPLRERRLLGRSRIRTRSVQVQTGGY